MSNNPVRQHYIPKMLLKRFSHDDSRINIYRKETNKFLPNQSLDNHFIIKDFYTHKLQQNLTTEYPALNDHINKLLIEDNYYELEKQLSKLESNATAVFRKIEENPHTPINEEDAEILKQFIIILIIRTPWGRGNFLPTFLEPAINASQITESVRDFLIHETKNNGTLLLSLLLFKPYLSQMMQRIFQSNIMIFDNPTKEPFIQSDVPVLIDNEHTIMIFPISKNHILYWNHDRNRKYNPITHPISRLERYMKNCRNEINFINVLMFTAAEKCIAGSLDEESFLYLNEISKTHSQVI